MEEEKHFIPESSSKNTSIKGCLLFLAVLAIFILAVLFVATLGVLVGFLIVMPFGNNSGNDSSMCLSPSCVELASTVLRNMDTTVDPCEDFYNYSCGGWVSRNVIPSGYGTWGVFQELAQQNTIYISKLLNGNEDESVDAIKQTRRLYRSCNDLDTLNSLGASPLIDLINKTGGWDLVGVHNSSSPKWSLGDENYRVSVRHGNPAYFGFGISVDSKNSSQYIASLQQSGLTLPSREGYYKKAQVNTTIPALRKYIVSTLSLLNPSADESDLTDAANQIIDLETELAKIFVSRVELRNIDTSYNPVMLSKNLSDGSLWKQFNWTSFVLESFETADVKNVDKNLVVIVVTPTYFANLSGVYDKFNETVHENYFKWQFINQYIPLLGDQFLNNYYAFSMATTGSGRVERYTTCISVLENMVPFSVSRLYTKYVLSNGTRENVTVMVDNIKKAFQARLDKNKWLDDTTIQRSKWKVGNITAMIAYPDGIYNETTLSKEAEIIDKADGALFETAVLYNAREYRENLQQFGKPVDKTVWEIAPTVVNAYYDPLFNGFVFLEGILNNPFFDAFWPYYFNYGAFGVVIGHELTHGFDDQGQRYNQNGVLTPWWTKESVDEFNKRKACFVEQYSKYSMFGLSVNGNLTLGENIADNGGLKTSYEAYTTLTKDKELPTLPGVDLSADELFFVAFGQVWCSIFTPEFLQSNLQTNPHSPGPYRVIGTLSNSEEFASVFKCPAGSRMNPKDKCDLW